MALVGTSCPDKVTKQQQDRQDSLYGSPWTCPESPAMRNLLCAYLEPLAENLERPKVDIWDSGGYKRSEVYQMFIGMGTSTHNAIEGTWNKGVALSTKWTQMRNSQCLRMLKEVTIEPGDRDFRASSEEVALAQKYNKQQKVKGNMLCLPMFPVVLCKTI